MDTNKTGAYLAMLRKAKGLTQEAAAEILGVSNKTVSKWETGGGFPEISVLPALAELYGVTADDILAGRTLRQESPPETAALKRRLMSRLRLRFDVCFAVSLALAVTARLAASAGTNALSNSSPSIAAERGLPHSTFAERVIFFSFLPPSSEALRETSVVIKALSPFITPIHHSFPLRRA